MIELTLTEKPDFLALTAQNSGFFPALLDSKAPNDKTGRFDILFAAPSAELVAFDQNQLQQLLNTIDGVINHEANKIPFQYGWLVYFSYESAYFMEPKLKSLMKDIREPLAAAVYCQGALVYDHSTHQTTVYAESQVVFDEITRHIDSASNFQSEDVYLQIVAQAPETDFEDAVDQAKALIQSGDIYQANLSRKYQYQSVNNINAVDIYASLSAANPAPFAALLKLNDFAVVSSSPERLFSVRDGVIETRPIAGTRPRGESETADLERINELLNTPKERAEHIMLIDLERNDMGKVCKTGTVKVDELMVIESYQHVHHIVSNITGELNNDVKIVEVIKALFPGGTITGCPKIRCMEVINEIEGDNRGCYTGSLGYINHDGQVDLNILIRTVAIQGNQLSFNAGAGIVYDSNPQAELQETKHKAQGMINALKLNAESNQAVIKEGA